MEQINKLSHVKVKEYENSCTDIPLVSICIVTYQHVDFIAQCLDSVLMQKTNFSYEIILGEDESTDGTREICIDYAKKYPDKIRLFLHSRENNIKINNTPTGRFNFLYGLSQARGKYIALLDGDDLWINNLKLKKQVDILESNTSYGLVYSDVNYFYESSGKIDKNILRDVTSIKDGDLFEQILIKNIISTSSVVLRKTILDSIDFKKAGTFKMFDKFIWLEFAINSKIGFLNQSTVDYRISKNSASSFSDKKKSDEFISSSFELNYYFIDKYSCSEETEKIVYNNAMNLGFKRFSKEIYNNAYERRKKRFRITFLQWLKHSILSNMITYKIYVYSYKMFKAFKS
jgi:glycosyltransferase involved in cell wall biosynthesis